MKKMIPILALCFVLPFLARADTSAAKPSITVTGSAEIKVVPDIADLSFSIEERNSSMNDAIKAESEKMTKLIAALRAAKVDEADIQTTQISIDPEYQRSGNSFSETEKIAYYRVTQTISCTIKQIKDIPTITAAAITAGANRTYPANLRTTKFVKYREDARAQALLVAKGKAAHMASVLNVEIGKPLSITEGYANQSNSIYNRQVQSSGIDLGSSTEAFVAGTITVNANVSVTFELK